MSAPGLPTIERPPAAAGPSLHPAFYIASWIFFSNLTIIFNKWLLDTAGFKYPAILTCWHLVFATIATQLLARFTTLLDSRHAVRMTGQTYLRAVVPIGLLYSGSLVCSNLVYLYLSVPFIQMLKAAAPVAVLLASWAFKLKDPSMRSLYNVLIIVFGVLLASMGEVQFSMTGFLFQVGGVVFEALRIVMIEVLLKGGGRNSTGAGNGENPEGDGGRAELSRMNPLVSLYYYAPVCAATNFLVAVLTESGRFKMEDLWRTGLGVLTANASVAFMLNVASVFLIGKTSSLVLTLTGILKNILLIIAAVLIWNDTITGLQVFGYAIAIVGLLVYSDALKREHIESAFSRVARFFDSPSLDESKLSARTRIVATFALGVLIVVLVYFGFMAPGPHPPISNAV